MFKQTEHGTNLMDDLIRQMQGQMLDGDYNDIAFQEMRIIVEEMQDKYANMSEDEKLIEKVRHVLVEVEYGTLYEDEVVYIENITGDTTVHEIFQKLEFDHHMKEQFVDLLVDSLGSQIYDHLNFKNEDWYNPTYDEECTLNELLGIRTAVKEKPKLVYHVKEETLYSILEDISGACVDTNSIQRYNLFDAIAKHIEKLRKDNNPA